MGGPERWSRDGRKGDVGKDVMRGVAGGCPPRGAPALHPGDVAPRTERLADSHPRRSGRHVRGERGAVLLRGVPSRTDTPTDRGRRRRDGDLRPAVRAAAPPARPGRAAGRRRRTRSASSRSPRSRSASASPSGWRSRRSAEGRHRRRSAAVRGDLLVAAGGALVFALNIAPTAEPVLLAAELNGIHLGLLVVASLVLPYLMVFYAEFGGRDQRIASDGATQGPVTETLLAYGVAFACLRRDARDVRTRGRREPGAARRASSRWRSRPRSERRSGGCSYDLERRSAGWDRPGADVVRVGAVAGLARRHPGRRDRARDGRALGTERSGRRRVTVTDAGDPASGGRPLEITSRTSAGRAPRTSSSRSTVGDVVREVNLDLVAKGDEESATVVVPDGHRGSAPGRSRELHEPLRPGCPHQLVRRDQGRIARSSYRSIA